MLLPLEESLIGRITEIDDDNPYPKQSNNVHRLAPTTTSPDLLSELVAPCRAMVCGEGQN
jgi:hypothetical protein